MTDLERIKKMLLDQGKKEYDDFDIIEYKDEIILSYYVTSLVAYGYYDTIEVNFYFDLTGTLKTIY